MNSTNKHKALASLIQSAFKAYGILEDIPPSTIKNFSRLESDHLVYSRELRDIRKAASDLSVSVSVFVLLSVNEMSLLRGSAVSMSTYFINPLRCMFSPLILEKVKRKITTSATLYIMGKVSEDTFVKVKSANDLLESYVEFSFVRDTKSFGDYDFMLDNARTSLSALRRFDAEEVSTKIMVMEMFIDVFDPMIFYLFKPWYTSWRSNPTQKFNGVSFRDIENFRFKDYKHPDTSPSPDHVLDLYNKLRENKIFRLFMVEMSHVWGVCDAMGILFVEDDIREYRDTHKEKFVHYEVEQ